MNFRPKSKLTRVAETVALGLIPLTCVAGLCIIALLNGAHHHGNVRSARHYYDMTRLAADARQVGALIHYLTEIEPPISTQSLAQNVKAPQPPLVTQSNYSLLLTPKKVDPI